MENPYVLVYLLNVISSLTREFTHAMRHGEGVDYGKFAESKAPAALIPHSPASPSIVAYVAMGKVSLAMPYYRQECALFEFSDNEEEAGQLLPAEIGLMYCNKLFYLLDGRCEISNNRAERKAKSYAIGRKAFLFHTSEAGASAVMYSIVETAKANNLNIFQYLYTVLLYMSDYMNSSAGMEQLMPWRDFIKEHCSGFIDVESNVPEKRIPLPLAEQRD